jgi:ATP-dependent RNA helicase RhlE
LREFKSGAVRVLVATDIAARGIDVEGISHVVNFDFPPQPEDYVHRIGRTGRAHAVGDAISFVTPEDYGALRALERFIARGIPRKKVGDFDYTEEKAPLISTRPQAGRGSSRTVAPQAARGNFRTVAPQPGRGNFRPAAPQPGRGNFRTLAPRERREGGPKGRVRGRSSRRRTW